MAHSGSYAWPGVDPGSCSRVYRKQLLQRGLYTRGRIGSGFPGIMGAQQTTTMPLKIEEPICIAATGDVCGEGVLWERDTQSVYWTDINRFLVHRYALQDGALKNLVLF